MTPGFYAAHDHFPGSGRVAVTQVDLNSPPVGTIENMDQLVAALAAQAEALPDGQWVSGGGCDDTLLLAEQRHLTCADLDRASATHPIYISHTSGHLAVANSLALELAGVTRDTPDPPGGVVRKDPDTGEPDGVFEEKGLQRARDAGILTLRIITMTSQSAPWPRPADEASVERFARALLLGGSRWVSSCCSERQA